MTHRIERTREVTAFLLSAGIVLLLLLLVVIPAQPQITPPTSAEIEVIAESQQSYVALYIVIAAQMILLWVLMFSYLRISHKVNESRHTPPHHWWNHVHLHLR